MAIVVKIDKELEDLVPLFLKNRHRDIERLKSAAAAMSFSELKSIGHENKGLGESYGFPHLTALGARIEQAADKEETDSIRTLVNEFESYVLNVRVEFIQAGKG